MTKVPFLAFDSKSDRAVSGPLEQKTAPADVFVVRLREAVSAVGGPGEVIRRSGIPKRTLANYLSGESEPKVSVLVQLADATQCTVDWLVGRSSTSSQVQVLAPHATSHDEAGRFVLVPKLAFRASAGPGRLAINVEQRDEVAFPVEILERAGVREEHALLAELVGESMSSTIEDGSLVLIDKSRRQVREGKIFAFTVGDDFYVKRLRREASGRLMKVSDNADLFPPEAIDHIEHFRVIGQVKWSDQLL